VRSRRGNEADYSQFSVDAPPRYLGGYEFLKTDY